jgi:hypothetical protein
MMDKSGYDFRIQRAEIDKEDIKYLTMKPFQGCVIIITIVIITLFGCCQAIELNSCYLYLLKLIIILH